MIFVDYLGPGDRFEHVRTVVQAAVAEAMRLPRDQVRVRRLALEDEPGYVELWIELSSEEQLYRLGRRIAHQVTTGLHGEVQPATEDFEDVWVMFRIVPRSHAFLNGEPRGRGSLALE